MSFSQNGLKNDPSFRMAVESDSTVLLRGPTGVGKSTLAKRIHDQSKRRDFPFVSINLATLSEGVIESELFGHARGAYTSAESTRVGKLESAQKGTVFLDEIGELPLRLQSRLLEFLQYKKISPMGSNRVVQLDVRVIAASLQNLEDMVEKKLFRADLFHRLKVVMIELPSIKDQSIEFNEIFHSCLEAVSRSLNKKVYSVEGSAADFFENYSWPGNFRELENAIEYAVFASNDGIIRKKDLPKWLLSEGQNGAFLVGQPVAVEPIEVKVFPAFEVVSEGSYRQAYELFEKSFLISYLNRNSGRINRTAREIQMSKSFLIRKMKKYGIVQKQSVGFEQRIR